MSKEINNIKEKDEQKEINKNSQRNLNNILSKTLKNTSSVFVISIVSKKLIYYVMLFWFVIYLKMPMEFRKYI